MYGQVLHRAVGDEYISLRPVISRDVAPDCLRIVGTAPPSLVLSRGLDGQGTFLWTLCPASAACGSACHNPSRTGKTFSPELELLHIYTIRLQPFSGRNHFDSVFAYLYFVAHLATAFACSQGQASRKSNGRMEP